jgi:hypothetical protein
MVYWFGPQNQQLRFGDLGRKITTMIFWFVPQNQVSFDLTVAWKQVWLGFLNRA